MNILGGGLTDILLGNRGGSGGFSGGGSGGSGGSGISDILFGRGGSNSRDGYGGANNRGGYDDRRTQPGQPGQPSGSSGSNDILSGLASYFGEFRVETFGLLIIFFIKHESDCRSCTINLIIIPHQSQVARQLMLLSGTL